MKASLFKLIILTLSLSVALPIGAKRAEGGLLVGLFLGPDLSRPMEVGFRIGMYSGAAVIGGAAVACYPDCPESIGSVLFVMILGGTTVGLAGVLLDIEANLPANQIAMGLKQNFPFIDNHEVFHTLSTRVHNKMLASQPSPEIKHVLVRFTREELIEILSATDLSDAQFNTVATALE